MEGVEGWGGDEGEGDWGGGREEGGGRDKAAWCDLLQNIQCCVLDSLLFYFCRYSTVITYDGPN